MFYWIIIENQAFKWAAQWKSYSKCNEALVTHSSVSSCIHWTNVYWVSFFSVPGSMFRTQNIMLRKAQPGRTGTNNLGQERKQLVSVEFEGDIGCQNSTQDLTPLGWEGHAGQLSGGGDGGGSMWLEVWGRIGGTALGKEGEHGWEQYDGASGPGPRAAGFPVRRWTQCPAGAP